MNDINNCIFCENCRFHHLIWGDYGDIEECRAKVFVFHNHRHAWKQYAKPEELNQCNNCQMFKPHLTLKEWIKDKLGLLPKAVPVVIFVDINRPPHKIG